MPAVFTILLRPISTNASPALLMLMGAPIVSVVAASALSRVPLTDPSKVTAPVPAVLMVIGTLACSAALAASVKLRLFARFSTGVKLLRIVPVDPEAVGPSNRVSPVLVSAPLMKASSTRSVKLGPRAEIDAPLLVPGLVV